MIKIETSGDYVQLKYVDVITTSVQEELKSDADAVECSSSSNGKIYLKFGRMTFEDADPAGFEIGGSAVTNAADFITKFNALFSFPNSNPGSGGLQSVTYAELVALIGSSGLTAGQQYLITDFATVHYIVDAAGTQYTGSIITGDTEPIIVTAATTNKLNSSAISTVFPRDVIHVDFDENNWLDDPSFADLSGTPTIVTGWKGTITYRWDTLLDNSTGYDFRNCKFRRWKTNVAAWDNGTTYAAGNFVTYNSIIYASISAGNLNKQPDTQNNYWVSVLSLANNEYWNNKSSSTNGITSDTAFADFKTFAEGSGSATYDICCRNNHFAAFKDQNSFFETSGSLLPNNVIFLRDQNYYTCDENSIGGSFINNTIYGYFTNNIIGHSFLSNQIEDDFVYNEVSNGFGGNIISHNVQNSTFGGEFRNNIIGPSFGNNTFGNGFNGNIIGDNCGNNTFGNNITNSKIISGFKMNEVQDNFPSTDFSSATHVYNSYNCSLFVRIDGTAKLSYFDNSDVLMVVNANA